MYSCRVSELYIGLVNIVLKYIISFCHWLHLNQLSHFHYNSAFLLFVFNDSVSLFLILHDCCLSNHRLLAFCFSNLKGDLSFVGRSGTAMDVRYTAHDFGEMPEEMTKHVVAFFSQNSKSVPVAKGIYIVHNSCFMYIAPLIQYCPEFTTPPYIW